jgi:hypothetical protein
MPTKINWFRHGIKPGIPPWDGGWDFRGGFGIGGRRVRERPKLRRIGV